MGQKYIGNKPHEKIKPWAVISLLVIWQIAAIIIDERIFLVGPVEVLISLSKLVFTIDFWASVNGSFIRIIGGFSFGVVLAAFLAVLAAKFKLVRHFLAPFMLTIKSVPVASFVILAIIWFSSQNLAILISFLMVLPIIYTSVLEGINATDKNLIEMADVFRMGKFRRVRYIYFFEVLPFFVSGVKVALGLCWKSGVAAEVIGIPDNSIGENLFNAKIFLDTSSLLAWTVVIVLISAVFERLFLFLLGKFCEITEKV